MDWPEALDILVARTKHERYRQLCDESHPNHGLWRKQVIELATGLPPAPPAVQAIPVSESMALLQAMRACPFWAPDPSCGCSGNRCAIARQTVPVQKCFECLKTYP